MKFLCIPCNEPMKLEENGSENGNGLNLAFKCPKCEHNVSMLTNSGEAQLVKSLGVQFGKDKSSYKPMATLRSSLTQSKIQQPILDSTLPEPVWTSEAEERLAQHPKFVQPVIRKTYNDYARSLGLAEITLEFMDNAKRALAG
ncbi:MAG: hypothetical protein FVQ83_09785 [Chloroflexi bacterium]|nr:hypothetical protein [Chloroflexota bacterium]